MGMCSGVFLGRFPFQDTEICVLLFVHSSTDQGMIDKSVSPQRLETMGTHGLPF